MIARQVCWGGPTDTVLDQAQRPTARACAAHAVDSRPKGCSPTPSGLRPKPWSAAAWVPRIHADATEACAPAAAIRTPSPLLHTSFRMRAVSDVEGHVLLVEGARKTALEDYVCDQPTSGAGVSRRRPALEDPRHRGIAVRGGRFRPPCNAAGGVSRSWVSQRLWSVSRSWSRAATRPPSHRARFATGGRSGNGHCWTAISTKR